MITISIVKTITTSTATKENLLVKETPTEYTEEEAYSGSRRKVAMVKEYSPQEVTKTTTTELLLLKQSIANDEDFDLAAVIVAINRLQQS